MMKLLSYTLCPLKSDHNRKNTTWRTKFGGAISMFFR